MRPTLEHIVEADELTIESRLALIITDRRLIYLEVYSRLFYSEARGIFSTLRRHTLLVPTTTTIPAHFRRRLAVLICYGHWGHSITATAIYIHWTKSLASWGRDPGRGGIFYISSSCFGKHRIG